MTPYDVLKQAGQIINQRGQDYGDIEDNFNRAAQIASLKLNVEITPYMVATVLESVKDARLANAPYNADSYVDGINYRAFRMMFAPKRKEDQTDDELVKGVEAIAKKFAPLPRTDDQ
jgi:hypothetical protein